MKRVLSTLLCLGLLTNVIACDPPATAKLPAPPATTAPALASSAPVTPPAPGWTPRAGIALDKLLAMPRASSPVLSSDGKQLAFVSDEPGSWQAFVTSPGENPRSSTNWRAISHSKERTHFVRFTPDGKWIFFGQDKGGDENIQIYKVPASGGDVIALTDKPKVKNMWGSISRDGRWFAYSNNERNGRDFDIIVRPIDGQPKKPIEMEGHNEVQDTSPDGKKLVVWHEHSSFNSDIYLVDVLAGTPRLLTKHEGNVRYHSPRFSSDGRTIWALSDQGSDYLQLVGIDVLTGKIDKVTDLTSDAEGLSVAQSSNQLAVLLNVDGYSEIRLFDAPSIKNIKETSRPKVGQVVIGSISLSGDGKYIAYSASRGDLPDEIYGLKTSDNQPSQITECDRAGVDTNQLIKAKKSVIKSFDDVKVPVFVYEPNGRSPDEKSPVVVSVHGGPEGQARPLFNPLMQFLVSHGYVVVEPNVRGSTGYGKAYSHLDDVEKREDSVKDLGAINQWLRKRPDIDQKRLIVMGGSYGGYMTLAAITLQPDLWAAACDIVGIANFKTFLERTAAYRRHLREAEYGSLSKDSEFLERVSPIRKVDAIKTPLFVIHGANDPRVPVEEAEQIVAALKQRNQRVEYMRFEDEGHGLGKRANRIKAYTQMVKFFDEILAAPL